MCDEAISLWLVVFFRVGDPHLIRGLMAMNTLEESVAVSQGATSREIRSLTGSLSLVIV